MALGTSFNTEQFAWADVTIQIGSRVLTAVQSIRYKQTQEKGYVYGKGNKPLTIQRGNYTFEGSIKMLQSELLILQGGAPNKNLMDYRNLSVTIGYENESGQLTLDQLVGVEFGEVEKLLEQNKQYMEIELPILFLDVLNDV